MRSSRQNVLTFVLLFLSAFFVISESAARSAIAAAPSAVTPASYYAHSHALLIGINTYLNLPPEKQLSYAASDARALREALVRSYGFPPENITLLLDEDATKTHIIHELSRLVDKRLVGPNDRILIFFSGHGQTVTQKTGEQMGFLIPSDAAIDLNDAANFAPYLETCIRMSDLWSYLTSSPAKHALVLADACYSGLMTQQRAGGRPPSAGEAGSLAGDADHHGGK